jgi:hypothetical protein
MLKTQIEKFDITILSNFTQKLEDIQNQKWKSKYRNEI